MYEAHRVAQHAAITKSVAVSASGQAHGRRREKASAKNALALSIGMLVAGMSSGAVAGAATLYVNDGTDKGCGAFNESSGSQINGAACAIKSMAELDAVGLASDAMVINGYGTFINGRLSMRAGIADADAVNVGQLSPVIEALGGGAKIDAATGEVTGPTYMLNDGDQTSVEGALYSMDGAIATANVSLSHLRSDLNSGSIGLVRQDGAGQDITVASDLAGDAVDSTGKKDGVSQSRRLTGVTDGTLSSTSSDAVTGAQLYATNKNVSSNTDHIAALQSQIGSGAIGLVRQDAVTGAIAVAGSTGGRRVDVAGAEGARVLGGLANGTADSDAVTIAQLKAAGLVDPDGKPMLALVYDDLAMGAPRSAAPEAPCCATSAQVRSPRAAWRRSTADSCSISSRTCRGG